MDVDIIAPLTYRRSPRQTCRPDSAVTTSAVHRARPDSAVTTSAARRARPDSAVTTPAALGARLDLLDRPAAKADRPRPWRGWSIALALPSTAPAAAPPSHAVSSDTPQCVG